MRKPEAELLSPFQIIKEELNYWIKIKDTKKSEAIKANAHKKIIETYIKIIINMSPQIPVNEKSKEDVFIDTTFDNCLDTDKNKGDDKGTFIDTMFNNYLQAHEFALKISREGYESNIPIHSSTQLNNYIRDLKEIEDTKKRKIKQTQTDITLKKGALEKLKKSIEIFEKIKILRELFESNSITKEKFIKFIKEKNKYIEKSEFEEITKKIKNEREKIKENLYSATEKSIEKLGSWISIINNYIEIIKKFPSRIRPENLFNNVLTARKFAKNFLVEIYPELKKLEPTIRLNKYIENIQILETIQQSILKKHKEELTKLKKNNATIKKIDELINLIGKREAQLKKLNKTIELLNRIHILEEKIRNNARFEKFDDFIKDNREITAVEIKEHEIHIEKSNFYKEKIEDYINSMRATGGKFFIDEPNKFNEVYKIYTEAHKFADELSQKGCNKNSTIKMNTNLDDHIKHLEEIKNKNKKIINKNTKERNKLEKLEQSIEVFKCVKKLEEIFPQLLDKNYNSEQTPKESKNLNSEKEPSQTPHKTTLNKSSAPKSRTSKTTGAHKNKIQKKIGKLVTSVIRLVKMGLFSTPKKETNSSFTKASPSTEPPLSNKI